MITDSPIINMKLFVALVLVAAVAADRLENTYLPPSSAKTAGGNGNFLSTPDSKYGAPDTKYAAPGDVGGNGAPSREYGAPSGRFNGNGNGQFSGAQNPDAGAATLRFSNENNGEGAYSFEYETENKIMHQESGELRNLGSDEESAVVVQGSYSYMGPDGILYTVNYVADENGFRATGDHIPTPPPIPEAIQKSLEQNAAAEEGNEQGYASGGNGQGYPASEQQGYPSNPSYHQDQTNHHGSQAVEVEAVAKQYQPPQAASRQYLAPNKPTFNQKSGYQY